MNDKELNDKITSDKVVDGVLRDIKPKYTPLPWSLNNYHHPWDYIVARTGPLDNDAFPGNRKICALNGNGNCQANAELIVKAVNNHEQLLEALKDVLPSITLDDKGYCPSCGRFYLDAHDECTSDICAGVIARAVITATESEEQHDLPNHYPLSNHLARL